MLGYCTAFQILLHFYNRVQGRTFPRHGFSWRYCWGSTFCVCRTMSSTVLCSTTMHNFLSCQVQIYRKWLNWKQDLFFLCENCHHSSNSYFIVVLLSSIFRCYLKNNSGEIFPKAVRGITSGLPVRYCQLDDRTYLLTDQICTTKYNYLVDNMSYLFTFDSLFLHVLCCKQVGLKRCT